MKILFIVPYPLAKSPSQRFRFEQYFQTLSQNSFTFHVQSFIDDAGWNILYQPEVRIKKFWVVIKGLCKRLMIPFHLPVYDIVFIHREVAPFGPPVLEWLIAKVFRKKIIYDFDDAIWLTDRKHESILLRMIKWRSKVASICRWSYRISAGNEYLCNFARLHNSNVVLNPTTIDTELLHNPALIQVTKNPDKLVIGWTGSHSTLKYLKEVEAALLMLEKKYPHVEFLVIADRSPQLSISNLRFAPWSLQTEITCLAEADIGIMPLPDDEWANGKCGFKALQYMALQMPVVISPVGVNTTIIEAGVSGFFATTTPEWIHKLEILINDADLRKKMGAAGREKIIKHYSVASNGAIFLSLFLK